MNWGERSEPPWVFPASRGKTVREIPGEKPANRELFLIYYLIRGRGRFPARIILGAGQSEETLEKVSFY
jgi:hypothetical protein